MSAGKVVEDCGLPGIRVSRKGYLDSFFHYPFIRPKKRRRNLYLCCAAKLMLGLGESSHFHRPTIIVKAIFSPIAIRVPFTFSNSGSAFAFMDNDHRLSGKDAHRGQPFEDTAPSRYPFHRKWCALGSFLKREALVRSGYCYIGYHVLSVNHLRSVSPVYLWTPPPNRETPSRLVLPPLSGC